MASAVVHELREYAVADQEYCAQTEDHRLPPPRLRQLGAILVESPEARHVYDAGWAATQMAISTGPDAKPLNLYLVRGIWRKAEAATVAHDDLRTRIAFNYAYTAAYAELLSGMPIDRVGLCSRLAGVNATIVRQNKQFPSSCSAIAAEVATATLIDQNALLTGNPNLAWPAMPWQDRHEGDTYNPYSNIDLIYGPSPDQPKGRIQVLSLLTPPWWQRKLPNVDEDAALEVWRSRYDRDIALIFGDVHLTNKKGDPVAINRLLAVGLTPSTDSRLEIAAQNIIDELQQTPNTFKALGALAEQSAIIDLALA